MSHSLLLNNQNLVRVVDIGLVSSSHFGGRKFLFCFLQLRSKYMGSIGWLDQLEGHCLCFYLKDNP